MQSRETNEEFAREQENANKGWETCYGAALKTRLKWIDQMLMEGTDEAHEKLLAFFADEKEIAPYGNRSNAMIEMIMLATDGMLVKRPILINGDKVLTGFKEAEWEEIIG